MCGFQKLLPMDWKGRKIGFYKTKLGSIASTPHRTHSPGPRILHECAQLHSSPPFPGRRDPLARPASPMLTIAELRTSSSLMRFQGGAVLQPPEVQRPQTPSAA